jgi:protein tyrosine phosphatase (PTP) superfamily phosphohydrolase (DUF442 family)
MTTLRSLLAPASLVLFAGLLGCAGAGRSQGDLGVVAAQPVPEPLLLEDTAFAAAGQAPLPEREADERPGLHNLYWLSDDILSGSEPEGQVALEELAELGIKTILSVDGKAPEHEAAAALGLRYVHVPIRYNGIEETEVLAIAKTFRELEGPFYVHCFHGKHRGPSAAAIGRVVLDGAGRDTAIGEMRQYCGTSEKYEGLYRTIATGDLPSPEETAAFEFDFPAEFRVEGLRQSMVELPRSFDLLVDLSKRDWAPKADHPDANARNEAAKLEELFSQLATTSEVLAAPTDFRTHVDESRVHAKDLVEALTRFGASEGAEREAANELAKEALGAVKARCTACHRDYRN